MRGPESSDRDEIGALSANLPTDLPPPGEARERIVSALAARGLLQPPGLVRPSRIAALLAAAAALFAAGLLTGRHAPAPLSHGAPRFVLFLSSLPGESAAGEPARVDEYRKWAADLRGHGRLISGEKLRTGARLLDAQKGAGAMSAGDVSGFFVVEAADIDQAVAVARTCPHLRHGGRITIRAIAPV